MSRAALKVLNHQCCRPSQPSFERSLHAGAYMGAKVLIARSIGVERHTMYHTIIATSLDRFTRQQQVVPCHTIPANLAFPFSATRGNFAARKVIQPCELHVRTTGAFDDGWSSCLRRMHLELRNSHVCTLGSLSISLFPP